MASTYLDKTFGSAGNRKTWTWSAWVKLSSTSGTFSMFSARNSTADQIRISLPSQSFEVFSENAGVVFLSTNRLFRDVSAWYHLVVEIDTTQATASNRVKMYVNGVQETSFSTATYPSQNYDFANFNNSVSHKIGQDNSSQYFDGEMAHIHFIDGTAYDADTFGSTDATTGIWVPKTSPSVTYGTNGFFLKFASSGSMGTDSSGNSNNFTVNGNLTQTQDTPANVFTTMNPLNVDFANSESVFSNGNTHVIPSSNSTYNYAMSTLAMPKGNGKFYFEAKYIESSNITAGVGIVDMSYASDIFYQNRQLMTATNNTNIGRCFFSSAAQSIISGTASSYGSSWSNNDIIAMACDMENGAFYFRINNGAWLNSGDPTSGASRTGAIVLNGTTTWNDSSNWGIWCGDAASGKDAFAFNFGNGYFQTTAVASAGTNASGIGIFEYDVPTGYTALSTKGLNL